MDEVLALVIAATVLLATAFSAVALVSTNFTVLDDSRSDIKQSSCRYQCQEVSTGSKSIEDLKPECRNVCSQSISEERETEILREEFECEITPSC
jgi:hypothetical protein